MCRKWEREHRDMLKKKAQDESDALDQLAAKANEWMRNFNQEREMALENKLRVNRCASLPRIGPDRGRDSESSFKSHTEATYADGPSWTRVASLVDMQTSSEKKDVARMRQVLLHVKAEPPAHMRA